MIIPCTTGEAPYMSFVEFTRLIEDAKIENLPQRNQRYV